MFWSNERRLSGCWWDFYAEIYKLFAGKLNSKPNNINAKQTKKLTQKSYITRHIPANWCVWCVCKYCVRSAGIANWLLYYFGAPWWPMVHRLQTYCPSTVKSTCTQNRDRLAMQLQCARSEHIHIWTWFWIYHCVISLAFAVRFDF